MRKTLLLVLLPLFLAACDNMTEVSRVPAGTHTVTQSVYCTYTGLCRACEYLSSGKSKCWLGYHQACDGHRDAVVNIDSFTVKYKSGRVDTENTTTVQSFIGDCK